METWKDISGFEGLYKVSDKGRVMSLERVQILKNGNKRTLKSKILKAGHYTNGYEFVILRKDGQSFNKSVHRLVANAFLDPIDGKYYVNHKNCNRTDNLVENLEWVTCSENIYHARTVGSAKFCYVEKPTTIIELATGIKTTFSNQVSVCKMFGKTNCWIGNKYRINGKPFVYSGYLIGVE